MCWSAIARPGTSPSAAADAAPSATAPIAAPMAAAIPRDIIRHLHLVPGRSRVRPLWYGHRRYNFGNGPTRPQVMKRLRQGAFLLSWVEVDGRHRLLDDATHGGSDPNLWLSGPDERGETFCDALDLLPEGCDLRSIGSAEVLQVRRVPQHLVQHVLD